MVNLHKTLSVILISCIVAFLTACRNDALETTQTDNVEISVGKLFTKDGCTVYRFKDGGSSRYFVKCNSGQSSVEWSSSCGKGCTRQNSIPTDNAD